MDWFADVLAQVEENKIKERKAIPSKVFFNHFFAINYNIEANSERYNIKLLNYYNNLKIRNNNFNLDTSRKLLWNSWSTEYAFNLTSNAENDDYYRFALHWHFPQAYYSVYLAMTAFHETQGVANDQHEKSIKIFGNSVKDNHYPEAIAFYANGLFKAFNFHGLNTFTGFDNEFNSLSKIECLEDAQSQIACFLKTTRKQNAENKRKRSESNYAKDPRFQTSKGELRKNLKKEHWNIIYQSIPETTLLNILYRLRIKANYHDIETFINADIDFMQFHKCLGNIVFYLNFVHEAYLHKCIGDENYRKILYDFSGHILDDRAKYRYEQLISKL